MRSMCTRICIRDAKISKGHFTYDIVILSDLAHGWLVYPADLKLTGMGWDMMG